MPFLSSHSDTSVIVLGAGMIGTCTALQLALRGTRVTLIDPKAPGEETSFGNAGIIQREAVEPYAFPREISVLVRAALGVGADIALRWAALPALVRPLLAYWQASSPRHYPHAVGAHAQLIAHCLHEHDLLFKHVATQFEKRSGYLKVYRSAQSLERAARSAERLHQQWSIGSTVLEPDSLKTIEPALSASLVLAGAVHWLDPWPINNPGALVKAYASVYEAHGGTLLQTRCTGLEQAGLGWRVTTPAGPVHAEHVVVASGPWAGDLIGALGYRFPLFVKRGYHQHFPQAALLQHPVLDADTGYVLAPMAQGLRMTTGAEFARRDAPLNDQQLVRCTAKARELLALGDASADRPWLGSRPCTPDMLPIMGAAPQHRGLWFNFGHAHQGFTLGPVTGRLLAELILGEQPFIDPAPYRPQRFR